MRGLRPTAVRGAALAVALVFAVASTLALNGSGVRERAAADLESQRMAVEVLALRLAAADQLDRIRAELIVLADTGADEVDISGAVDVADRLLLEIAPMSSGPLGDELMALSAELEVIMQSGQGDTSTNDRLVTIDDLVDEVCCRALDADVGGDGWRTISALIVAHSYTTYAIDTVVGGIYLRDGREVVEGTITDYMSWNMDEASNGEPLDWDPLEPYLGGVVDLETDPTAAEYVDRPVRDELATAYVWALGGGAAAGEPSDVTIEELVRWVEELSQSETGIIREAITEEHGVLTAAIAAQRTAQVENLWLAIGGYVAAALMVAGTLVAMMRDQTQADLRRSEAQAKLDMLAMVAHELRSPLTGITGFTQLLHSDWKVMDDDQIQEFLGLVNGQAEELMRLIDDLLTIRRIETGSLDLHPARVRVADVAQRVASSVFREASRSVQVDLDPDMSVVCDPDRMAQILRNLLENARKYGGPTIRVTSDTLDGRCRISVIDDGAGVAPKDVERIFARFDQGSVPGRADTGFGLGLSIVKDLAEAMGGDVGYLPVAPNGAQFWVDLPVGIAQAEHQPAPVG
ncbi:MAG: sensor histidine kinase [Acidimicrobiia bacterium]